MYGIAWNDIQGTIPRPVQAFAADNALRRAECILWRTPDAPKPYEVEIRLLDDGSVVETWSQKFGGQAGLNKAFSAYTLLQEQATKWLIGASRSQVRPRTPPWRITKSPPAD